MPLAVSFFENLPKYMGAPFHNKVGLYLFQLHDTL